jgi:menaquinone-dependent protoporphyrinogen IX oxidase
MKKMKVLVVFYSRTGTTRKLAEFLSKKLEAEVDEIIDLKKRNGPIGYMIAGKDATLKRETKIRFKKDPEKYDLVIIGTPIWAWTITPAVRAYLNQNKENLKEKKLAFFCTMGGSGDKGAFSEMEKLTHKSISYLALTTKEVIKEEFNKVKEFLRKLR